EGNPININRLMWLGAGAGSKGLVAGMVSGFAPQAGITPDVAGLLIGFFLAQQGGDRMGVFGEGMLIASVGQLVRQPIEGIFGSIGKPKTPETPPPEQSAAKSNASTPSTDVDKYLAAAYGIV
ncbi:unnamed protein product, partial [marine sediment metagenome]